MGKVLRNIQLTGAVLIMIATVVAFGVEIKEMVVTKEINLADILLLFIYLEVLGMVTSYWGAQKIRLTYPLFIAITAIAYPYYLSTIVLPLLQYRQDSILKNSNP